MDLLIPVLIGVVGIAVVAFLFLMLKDRSGPKGGTRTKGRDAILKSASRRLDQNPRDPEALSALGDLYYREENWDQAYKAYSTLADLGSIVPDEFEANLRLGMTALRLGLTEEAHRGLSGARRINPNNFELAYNLGLLEFQRKNYEKAIQILNQARAQEP